MKTYQPKENQIKREWHLMDAEDQVLGRLASKIASLLMGKGKSGYSTHMDVGDYVVVVNAEKIAVTGKKAIQKVYRSHSGYPGGYKEVSFERMMERFPQRILENAVFGMLPGNRLRNERMKRLKLIVGDKNPFENKFK